MSIIPLDESGEGREGVDNAVGVGVGPHEGRRGSPPTEGGRRLESQLAEADSEQ